MTLPPGGVLETLVGDGNYRDPTPVAPVTVAFVPAGGGTRIVASVGLPDRSGRRAAASWRPRLRRGYRDAPPGAVVAVATRAEPRRRHREQRERAAPAPEPGALAEPDRRQWRGIQIGGFRVRLVERNGTDLSPCPTRVAVAFVLLLVPASVAAAAHPTLTATVLPGHGGAYELIATAGSSRAVAEVVAVATAGGAADGTTGGAGGTSGGHRDHDQRDPGALPPTPPATDAGAATP